MATTPKKSPAKKQPRPVLKKKTATSARSPVSKKKFVSKPAPKSHPSKSKSAKPAKAAKPAKVKTAKVKAVKVKTAKVKSEKAPAPKAPSRAKPKERFEDSADFRPEPSSSGPVKLTPFLKQQHTRLVELRDHVLDQMQDVSQGNLRAAPESGGGSAFGQHMGDAGSDAYEKDFALSLLSQEQDSLYEIDEAIKRIEAGTYGTCEMSGKVIPKARLEAIPWARYTVECQSKVEKESKGRNRWSSTPQFMDNADLTEDEDEESDEEESKPKAAKE